MAYPDGWKNPSYPVGCQSGSLDVLVQKHHAFLYCLRPVLKFLKRKADGGLNARWHRKISTGTIELRKARTPNIDYWRGKLEDETGPTPDRALKMQPLPPSTGWGLSMLPESPLQANPTKPGIRRAITNNSKRTGSSTTSTATKTITKSISSTIKAGIRKTMKMCTKSTVETSTKRITQRQHWTVKIPALLKPDPGADIASIA